MSEILNEPSVEVTETVEAVEPSAENDGVQNDPWDEDFDTTEIPREETTEVVEPNEETVTNEQPEYITKGLGDLAEPIVVKVNGKIYDIKDKDQIRDLMERGFNATQKLQELAQSKRELLKEKNPDITEQELDSVDVNNEVEQISSEILNSPNVEEFKNVFAAMPEEALNQFRSNPGMLRGLKVDIDSGFVGHIMPSIQRYMDIDGMGFQEAYMTAGQEYHEGKNQRQQKENKVNANRELLSNAPSNSSAVASSESKDIWEISDSDYKSLMNNVRQ